VLLLGVLATSTASIFIRYAQEEAASLVVAAYRMGIAALVLAPFSLKKRRLEIGALNVAELGLAALSGVLLALHFATWIQSLEYTSVANSVVIVTTNSLWIALLAHFLLGERLSRSVLIGLLVAMAGGAIVGLSDSCIQAAGSLSCPPLADFVRGQAFLGDILALIGAVTGAGYFLIRRRLREKLSLDSYIFVVYGVAALVLAAMVLVSGQPVSGFAPATYLWLVLLAIVPQLLGHSSFNWALGHLPAAYVSLALLGEPIGSTLLAVGLFGEVPGGMKILGAALILTGIALASWQHSRKLSPQV
jgi:drug/metabolite transporter (DMT)-like permease